MYSPWGVVVQKLAKDLIVSMGVTTWGRLDGALGVRATGAEYARENSMQMTIWGYDYRDTTKGEEATRVGTRHADACFWDLSGVGMRRISGDREELGAGGALDCAAGQPNEC